MERYIEPKTLAKISDLSLVAKTIAEGFLYGLQRSRQRGIGIEFSQYRAYESGDELSRIDWKLYARSDRYFVREAVRESEINVHFLLDSSRSMSLASQVQKDPNGLHNNSRTWDKLLYAKHLIASLSFLAQKQGDAISYLSFNEKTVQFLPTGNGVKHWHKLLQQLHLTQSQGNFVSQEQLFGYYDRLNGPALIILVTDFQQHDNEIIQLVKRLNHSKTELAVLQLQSNDELNFNYRGDLRLRDPETMQQVEVNAELVKRNYLQVLNRRNKKQGEQLAGLGIAQQAFNIDKPLDAALIEYLKQRSRMG